MKRDGVFIQNNWYVVGLDADVGQGPTARMICGQPIVFFRTASGNVVALMDRCVHRGMPFSAGGTCEDEIIRCPYHGLEFDSFGMCVKIPGQDRIPPAAKVRSFPLAQKDKMIWIWMGAAERADPARIPDHPFHSDPSFVWTSGRLDLQANWLLLSDNLLDLTHLQYIHKNTIGGNPEEDARAEIKVERKGEMVLLTRTLRDMTCPPMQKKLIGFKGNVDRVQEVEFRPGLIQIHSSTMDAGDSYDESWRDKGMHLRHLHAITPETETTTAYLWTMAHNFQIENQALTDKLHELTVLTFNEDIAVLAAQQSRLRDDPEFQFFNTRHDAATVQARRLVSEMFEQESASTNVTKSYAKEERRSMQSAQ